MVLAAMLLGLKRSSTLDFGPDSPAIWWRWWWFNSSDHLEEMLIIMVILIIAIIKTLLEAFLRRCSGDCLPLPAATLRTTSFAWVIWLWCLLFMWWLMMMMLLVVSQGTWSRLPELISHRGDSGTSHLAIRLRWSLNIMNHVAKNTWHREWFVTINLFVTRAQWEQVWAGKPPFAEFSNPWIR